MNFKIRLSCLYVLVQPWESIERYTGRIQGVFYDFTTLILYYSKSLTTFITNSSGILEYLEGLQENLIQFNGEA